jgi:hypothetical protein
MEDMYKTLFLAVAELLAARGAQVNAHPQMEEAVLVMGILVVIQVFHGHTTVIVITLIMSLLRTTVLAQTQETAVAV